VDTGARRATRAGVELALTAKEFELLTALIRRAGDVVSREALFSEVWGDEKASASKKLDMHISWLRRKLGDDVDSPRYISTVRGLGFRFETR
ncbi:winged helix-turn-helix domain-containing protein, partial [Actinotignum schaalii]